jgi:Flp pilus assembly secretin CpaC
MKYLDIIHSKSGTAIACLLLAGAAATPVEAAGTAAAAKPETPAPVVTSRTESGPTLTMVVNKSTILRLDVPAVRISVGNPAVADITPISSREVIVLGKAIGTTNLIIWDKSGVATMRDVIVTPEPVIAAPPPPSEERDAVEVIKGLNKSKMEF